MVSAKSKFREVVSEIIWCIEFFFNVGIGLTLVYMIKISFLIFGNNWDSLANEQSRNMLVYTNKRKSRISSLSQLTQRRRKIAVWKVWNESRNYLFKTSSALGPHKTSSRFFLVKSKNHLETIYRRCIYMHFKLGTFYHFIIIQTNCINLNKLNMLKHETDA